MELTDMLYADLQPFLVQRAAVICRRYHCDHLREDLLSAGAVALCEHIDRYDESRGVELSTWLRPYIDGAMLRLVENSLAACVFPKRALHDIRKAHAIYNKLDAIPNVQRVGMAAKEMGIPITDATFLLMQSTTFSYLDDDHDQDEFLVSFELDPAKIFYRMQLYLLLEQEFQRMSFKEREIIGGCFGVFGHKKRSLADLGEQFQMREASVGRARDKALTRLRTLCMEGDFGRWQSLESAIRQFRVECAIADADCGPWELCYDVRCMYID